jgi:hypothetical protein
MPAAQSYAQTLDRQTLTPSIPGASISLDRDHDFANRRCLFTLRRNRVHHHPKSCSPSAEITVHVGAKYPGYRQYLI